MDRMDPDQASGDERPGAGRSRTSFRWRAPALLLVLSAAGLLTDSPAAAQELSREELQRLFDRSGAAGAGGAEAGPEGLPSGLPGGLERFVSPLRAPPAIHLLRNADPVEVLRGDTHRVLQYWDPHLELGKGDRLVQGPKARCLVDFPDGSSLRLDGPAVLDFHCDVDSDPRALDLRDLSQTLILQVFEVPLVISLPGGNEMVVESSRVTVQRFDDRALEIRNTGPTPVSLRGPYLGDRVLNLPGGTLVLLPVLPVPLRPPVDAVHTDVRFGDDAPQGSALVGPEVRLDAAGPSARLTATGTTQALVEVAGTRLLVSPGRPLEIRRSRPGRTQDAER